MYFEIHPFYHDSQAAHNALFADSKQPWVNFYKPAPPIILELNTIRQIREEKLGDGSGEFARLVINDDYLQDIIISKEEKEIIREKLLKTNNPVANALERIANSLEKIASSR